ncbi:MAG: DUF5054 domain-containing protein [Christensenellaceae bacterium]|nr:DUF5054 domain-containing protein [Christensenellaceae bacterium]
MKHIHLDSKTEKKTPKLYIVAKTHLDLGFTDFAENILIKYRNDYIPNAIKMANILNSQGRKRFVWTTGSFLIDDALKHGDTESINALNEAITKGYVAWHALPFTLHTELLDTQTFNEGLDISKRLDNKYGINTIAAKATDVPGHTIASVHSLAQYGVKLLHIGVNGASAVPHVPKTFLWKYKDAEIIVIYDESYGGIYKSEYTNDILYFFHSDDNKGPGTVKEFQKLYKKLENEYPDYEICASSLNDFADVLWRDKGRLPIVDYEIGDTWIHGIMSDPFKTGLLRELMKVKKRWLTDGINSADHDSYDFLSINILKGCEHTWGLDVKRHLGDFNNYSASDLLSAINNDIVRLEELPYSEINEITKAEIRKGEYSIGSYSKMVKSWDEQRNYLIMALDKIPHAYKKGNILEKLRPITWFSKTVKAESNIQRLGNFEFCFNELGLSTLKFKEQEILSSIDSVGSINIRSYSPKNLLAFRDSYMRDYDKNKFWSEPDFLRPLLDKYENEYPVGDYNYKLSQIYMGSDHIISEYKLNNEDLVKIIGAPDTIEVKYTVVNNIVNLEIIWVTKLPSRLPHVIFFYLPTKDSKNIVYYKMGHSINHKNIVKFGNKNLSSVEKIEVKSDLNKITIVNQHAPLVSPGKGQIIEIENDDLQDKHGLSFVLYNNIWGTNFPLWYTDSAYFMFEIYVDVN